MAKNPPFLVSKERQVRRYSLRNLGSSLLDAFNFEYGLLHTAKALLLNPGKSTIDYLGEGRLKYFSPFRLLVLSTAVLLLLINSTELGRSFEEGFKSGVDISVNEETSPEAEQKVKAIPMRIYELFQEYFNLLIWLYIPVVSFFTYLLNRKKGLNYAEHVVFNTYYTSIINLLSVVLYLGELINFGELMMYIYLLISLGYYVWYYRSLFPKKWLRASVECLGLNLVSIAIYSLGLGFLLGFGLAAGWIPM